MGGSFHTTPPRSTQVPPVGPTLGGAKDLATLTALSSLVSELMQKVSTLETELKAHKLLFKDVVGQLVKKVKDLEWKLKTRSRKSTSGVYLGALTGPSTFSPGITTVPTSSFIPAAETIPAGSDTTPESP
ncbi:hypothetical protein Tco_0338006, partial [Tanacetum coccineum]